MKKLLTMLLCLAMAFSCAFGVAACTPTDDKDDAGTITPGGTEQPDRDEQNPGGDETPEPAPEPSDGLQLEFISKDNADSLKEVLGYYYTPCYGFFGMGTCTDTEIVIPSEYNGYPVCIVYLDDLSESVTSLYIPDSVDLIFCNYAPHCKSLTDLRLPRNPDLMILKISPTETTPSPFANCAFYQDPDNWENGALYTDGWLLATNEDLPTDYAVKADTYGVAGMAFLDTFNISAMDKNVSRSHVEHVTLPESVKAIQAAFTACQTLKEVDLPNDISAIGSAAFYACFNLKTIHIPESVTQIKNWAFSGCFNLTTVVIPASVVSVDERAFFGCEKLTSIVIPDSVKDIGEYAFEDCSSLTTVYYTGNEEEWKQIEIGKYNNELLNAEFIFNYMRQ